MSLQPVSDNIFDVLFVSAYPEDTIGADIH
jgi:hypothetical protein